jgi:IS5 family transposase
MRVVKDPQMKLGAIPIGDIKFDPKSRDDIPRILLGLQYIYVTPEVRQEVFKILEELIPDSVVYDDRKANPNKGRKGMEQWTILVLGTLRLGLNDDYDRIHELANHHDKIRQMLGHSDWYDETYYELQTIKDNLRLFTPDMLDRINKIVVRAGHVLLKKKEGDVLVGRCDSFVVETDIHYPTDINLLFDSIRKIIQDISSLCKKLGITDWRQSNYILREFKKLYETIQKLKYSTSKDEEKRKDKEKEIHKAYNAYIVQAEQYIERALQTLKKIEETPQNQNVKKKIASIMDFIVHATRQADQTDRRVLKGEKIPHQEKVFSVFQPHTQWINKGKAGVPVEFGLPVAIMEDSDGFILHHHIMEKRTDSQIAVEFVRESQTRFPMLRIVSMDKGFHSPENQTELRNLLDRAILPKKGRLSQSDQAREQDPEFIRFRHKHSAVESAINALEAHGLDKCPDDGIDGFKRYVALAVVARNLHRLGSILMDRKNKEHIRQRRKAAA